MDELKIDRAYVQDITEDPNDAAIVQTILSMARHLGLAVVAEGVETLAQAEFLRDNGCHRYQGFLYCRPLSASDITRRILPATNDSGLAMHGPPGDAPESK